MDDHVARINQHPVAGPQTLDPSAAVTSVLELAHKVIGDGAHMPVGPAGGDHHHVANRGFALKVDGDDIFGFVIVERGEHELFQRIGRDQAFRLGVEGRARVSVAAIEFDGQRPSSLVEPKLFISRFVAIFEPVNGERCSVADPYMGGREPGSNRQVLKGANGEFV